MRRPLSEAEALAAEAKLIRDAYLTFWGAHSVNQIIDVGTDPTFPSTPTLDRWYPRDGSPGMGVTA